MTIFTTKAYYGFLIDARGCGRAKSITELILVSSGCSRLLWLFLKGRKTSSICRNMKKNISENVKWKFKIFNAYAYTYTAIYQMKWQTFSYAFRKHNKAIEWIIHISFMCQVGGKGEVKIGFTLYLLAHKTTLQKGAQLVHHTSFVSTTSTTEFLEKSYFSWVSAQNGTRANLKSSDVF